jgi:hypothetical protein
VVYAPVNRNEQEMRARADLVHVELVGSAVNAYFL